MKSGIFREKAALRFAVRASDVITTRSSIEAFAPRQAKQGAEGHLAARQRKANLQTGIDWNLVVTQPASIVWISGLFVVRFFSAQPDSHHTLQAAPSASSLTPSPSPMAQPNRSSLLLWLRQSSASFHRAQHLLHSMLPFFMSRIIYARILPNFGVYHLVLSTHRPICLFQHHSSAIPIVPNYSTV